MLRIVSIGCLALAVLFSAGCGIGVGIGGSSFHHHAGVSWHHDLASWRAHHPGEYVIGTSGGLHLTEKDAVNDAWADAKTRVPKGLWLEEYSRYIVDNQFWKVKILYRIRPEPKVEKAVEQKKQPEKAK